MTGGSKNERALAVFFSNAHKDARLRDNWKNRPRCFKPAQDRRGREEGRMLRHAAHQFVREPRIRVISPPWKIRKRRGHARPYAAQITYN